MWNMESNVFEISQVVFFLCCPSPTHFLPCQFLWTSLLPNFSLWTCIWTPYPFASCIPFTGLSLVWPKISTTSVCHPPAEHQALCLPLGSMLKLCLHTTSARNLFFPPLLRYSGDLVLHLIPSWKSLDRLIFPTGGGVGKVPTERSSEGCSSPAWCCILGPARQSRCSWPWVTSKQKVW